MRDWQHTKTDYDIMCSWAIMPILVFGIPDDVVTAVINISLMGTCGFIRKSFLKGIKIHSWSGNSIFQLCDI